MDNNSINNETVVKFHVTGCMPDRGVCTNETILYCDQDPISDGCVRKFCFCFAYNIAFTTTNSNNNTDLNERLKIGDLQRINAARDEEMARAMQEVEIREAMQPLRLMSMYAARIVFSDSLLKSNYS